MRNTALSTKDKTFYRNNEQTITSLEVAEMVEKEHSKLLKDIRRYADYLNEAKIGLVEFFSESTYVDAKGETRPCYNITKKGCEFIANKFRDGNFAESKIGLSGLLYEGIAKEVAA